MALGSQTYTRSQVVFPSAARTTHTISNAIQFNQQNYLSVHIDITAFTGTSITFSVQYYDRAKAAYVTLLASSALAATGHTVLTLGPDCANTANVSAQTVLPRTLKILPSGTITSVTYSVVAISK